MDKELSGKAPPKPGRRERLKSWASLSDRLIAVMKTIAEQDGGPVATAQIATLNYPSDVASMLRNQGLDTPTVAAVMKEYPVEHLGQRVELGKFLYKLARTAPEQLATLDSLYQQVLTMRPDEWLLRAMASDVEPPEMFTGRVRRPSEFVSSQAKESLRYLVEAEMVIVDEMPVRRREGSGQYLYYLSARGRHRLAKELDVEVQEIPYRRPGALSSFRLLHHLQCVDLDLAVQLGCRRLGYRLIKKYTDGQLKKLMGSYKVTYKMRHPDHPNSVEELAGMTVPDYFFIIEANGKVFAHLVEVDRGSITVRSKPGHRDFKRRVAILSQMYKGRLYHQLFPEAGNSFRYLVITTGGVDATGVHDRVRSLKTAAEEAIREANEGDKDKLTGLQRYWFAHWSAVKPSTTDYFSSQTILDGKWWLQAGDEQQRALIW